MTIAAIVLAAGGSRRLGQPKQLLRLEGETLVERAIRLAGEAGARPVLAILGAQGERIRREVDFERLGNRYGAAAVMHAEWEEGVGSSIHAAMERLGELAPDARGVLILGCDQPRLTAEHLRAMMDEFERQPAAAMVASTYAGIEGIPAIFPAEAFEELRALGGDRGARSVLKGGKWPLIGVAFAGGEVDIDTPTDLKKLK